VATALYVFPYDTQEGDYPSGHYSRGGLVEGKDGNLYGTAEDGGTGQVGTVFRISLAGAFEIVYNFRSQPLCSDGQTPMGRLALGTNGNLFGATTYGGYGEGNGGYGVIYEITPEGLFKVLHLFNVTDGAYPSSGLLAATDGNFYGVCAYGGTYNLGTLFRVSPSGAFTVLHDFGGPNDGTIPTGDLIQAKDGKIYGTTLGSYSGQGGIVFSSNLSGTYKKIYDFYGSTLFSSNALLQASDGNLYSTALVSPCCSPDSIFELNLNGTLVQTVE